MKDNRIYLEHVLDNLQKIESSLAGFNENQFLEDVNTQDATLRRLQVIGEAVKRLSPELRLQNSHVPWRGITGMRDKLTHDYIDVDLEEVWRTATVDLPTLKTQIENLINTLQ